MQSDFSISDLVSEVSQLDHQTFKTFMSDVVSARAQRESRILSAEEAQLLTKINNHFPEILWSRLEYLDEKMENDKISTEEWEELNLLNAEFEKFSLKRMKLLGKLADLRGVTISELMKELGIVPNRTNG